MLKIGESFMLNRFLIPLCAALLIVLAAGCDSTNTIATVTARAAATNTVPDDTAWFSDSILYSVFVRSFRDSNGDGIGDLVGVPVRLPLDRT